MMRSDKRLLRLYLGERIRVISKDELPHGLTDSWWLKSGQGVVSISTISTSLTAPVALVGGFIRDDL